MKAITFAAAEANLAETIRKVCEHREAVLITSKENQAVVMLSLDDYEILNQTAYLLRSSEIRTLLKNALERLERGTGEERGAGMAEIQVARGGPTAPGKPPKNRNS